MHSRTDARCARAQNRRRRLERDHPRLLPVAAAVAPTVSITSAVSTSATITVTAIVPAVSASLMLLRAVLANPVLAHLLV